MSFQTDHSIWCVLVAFLTTPKPHFKVLRAQSTTIFHVKMLISHDNMKAIEAFLTYDYVPIYVNEPNKKSKKYRPCEPIIHY